MGPVVDQVLARETSGGTVAWYLPDRLGTIRDIVDNTGAVIDHVDYSAYGKVLDESAPSVGDRLTGFAGLERDTATGLNLAVYRVQDPGTGTWLNEDPLGFAAGDADLYRYVENEPTNATDSSGLQFMLPAPSLPGDDTYPVYDYRQYDALYDKGEISWWEWMSVHAFPPSDVPIWRVVHPGCTHTVFFPPGNGPPVVMPVATGTPPLIMPSGPGAYLGGKAPRNVTPGVRSLSGNYINDRGRVEPWKAHYDQYGRLIGRTDCNAGKKAQKIPDVHHHKYEYNSQCPNGRETHSHVPGEYPQ